MTTVEKAKPSSAHPHSSRRSIPKAPGTVTPTPEALRRLAPGTSLNDIERGTGISVSHLSRVFNGRRNLSSDNLQAVAGYLGVAVDKLLSELQRVA
jgi:transcriptional regulator with XRE-family HTH domain